MGSPQHLSAARFSQIAGVSMEHVPYKGSGQAMTDLLGGNVDMNFDTLPGAINQIQAGKTRTRGVELELRGRVTKDVDVIANYIYTDPDPQLEGLPKHMASRWGKYRFALAGQPGFAVGAGVRYLTPYRAEIGRASGSEIINVSGVAVS
ncbi:hypothetical protein G6F23_014873 [Rhizopus arrhizus]|nr:hypothetical protein G6F23_014873 [Rhizopus arrhizus]